MRRDLPVFEGGVVQGTGHRELGIENGPDLYGAPVTINFDNGAEAKGLRMGRLTQIGTAPVYLKSRNPQKKPYIERLNRSVKEALQTLQGSTRFDDEDGMRDPELLGDLPMPLAEFKRWLARFYFEEWVDKPLERFVSSVFVDDRALGNSPRERFENMAYRDGYVYPLSTTERSARCPVRAVSALPIFDSAGKTCQGSSTDSARRSSMSSSIRMTSGPSGCWMARR
jgi:hypothetical protein